METPNRTIYLLNAYIDLRWNKTEVKINVITTEINSTSFKFFCQFWFDGKTQPIVVKASEYQTLWFNIVHTKIFWEPYLISCPVTGEIPHSVSLTVSPCDSAENNLKIINNQPPDGVKKEFGVCVKQLTYPYRDFAIRFIEWIEMLRILGNTKVHFHNRFLHPETMKIVRYYESQGLLEAFDYLEPSILSNNFHRTLDSIILEAVMVNDCFYRVQSLYKYVAIIDPDEFLMPLNESHRTWHDLIASQPAQHEFVDVFSTWMITFPPTDSVLFDGIPNYHYMLQNIQRIATMVHHKKKAFVNTETAIVTFVHGAYLCRHNSTSTGECRKFFMRNAQSNHYRDSLMFKESNETVEDKSIWKFKNELIAAVNLTLTATNFKP